MKRIIGFSIFILAVTLFSCQNDDVNIPDDGTLSEKSAQISLNEVKMESAATEVEYEVEFYANAEEMLTRWWKMGKGWQWTNKLRYRMNQCPDVHIESEEGGYPKKITLDYGEETVLRNGKVLSGVIIIDISAPKKTKDYTRLVTYDNFGIDTLTVVGTSSVTIDKNIDAFRVFESSLTFTLADGTVVERDSERRWEWVEGMDTQDDQNDDVIEITGFVNASIPATGDTYEKKIIEPLIRLRDCRYIVKGIVEIWLNGELISSLDYGDGTCNDFAILTKDGETHEVDLSKCKMKNKNKNSNQNGNG